MRTVDKNEPVKLNNFKVNFIDTASLNPEPKLGNKLVDLVFKECRPTQNDRVQAFTRAEAEAELTSRLGTSRAGTEEDQTPWYTKWKKSFLASNRF
jgi:hypothetical protein